jgi:hypothetical protein
MAGCLVAGGMKGRHIERAASSSLIAHGNVILKRFAQSLQEKCRVSTG